MSPEEPAADIGRFGQLVRATPLPLGEVALVVASVLGHPDPVADGRARLDALAADVPGDDLAAVTHHLFSTVGFKGDTTAYYDPANSLLPAVLERRKGIPITLAIVAVEVARRLGVSASVVGMPGHVLIGDGDPPERWVDGFHGGAWLDVAGARARFATIHGRHAPFDPRYLAALPDVAVVARLLANLVGVFNADGDIHRLVRVRELRAAIPGVGERERTDLAAALAAVGRFEEAADLWRRERDTRTGEAAAAADQEATRLRAHLN
ncbi:transglutaminase-like domain-containing protein [Aquihabitans sp. G128]|uniref:transglutaminase-like domain-containing protein n=1 Tax=Aquihabitans sp. G128 TaxID=2849779 RepID=UPI001C24D0B7|nr:transglutaminase-like domain-containing protein [Aquihabitans sp. G128]QXC62081.1 transglutaminase-like domain-containing protein [Aquihabitans sp. G128]